MPGRILGAIAALWGAGILISNLLVDKSYPSDERTYNNREVIIILIGVLLILSGVFYLIKGTPKGKRLK